MQRLRRPPLATMAAALLLLGASACGTGAIRPGPGAAEGWRHLAAAPLSPRIGHSAVWTGSQLLLWGGRIPGGGAKADGAAYDPARDRWSRLPPAPLAGRFGHAAVWTGTEVLVWGGVRPVRAGRSEVALADGAAYRPATRRWRRIAPAPLPGTRRCGPASSCSPSGTWGPVLRRGWVGPRTTCPPVAGGGCRPRRCPPATSSMSCWQAAAWPRSADHFVVGWSR
jgi:Galactose oxidase, central domain